MLTLRAMEIEEAIRMLDIRNDRLDALRTSGPMTVEAQKHWYVDVVVRSMRDRWRSAFNDGGAFVGYCGIEYIQWENRLGEISALAIHDDDQAEIINAAIRFGFDTLNLNSLYAEVYTCNRDAAIWTEAFGDLAECYTLPMRKWYQGKWYDSKYYVMVREDA